MKPSVWKLSIVVGCAVAFVVLAPYTTAQIDPAKNWLQGRYDALNTGFSPTTLPSKPRLLWKFSGTSPEGATLHPDSGSAIYNGVLFTSADKNPSNVEGNSQSDFYAFNALTGQVLWTYFPNQLGAKHDGLVAVDVDRGLVLYPAHDGCIRALDKDTGSLAWKFQACDNTLYPCDLDGGVTVANGRAYYVSKFYLHALDPDRANPTELWKFYRGDTTKGIATKPAVSGGKVFFGGYQKFWAIDEQSGQMVWERPASLTDFTYGFNIPHVQNNVVYVLASQAGTTKTIATAMNVTNGSVVWEKTLTLNFAVKSSIGYGKWFIGFTVGDTNGGLLALDLATGRELWRFQKVGSRKVGRVNSGPAVANNKVVFGSTDNYLYMLDQQTGRLLWSYNTGKTIHAAVSVADGRIYVGSNKTYWVFGP